MRPIEILAQAFFDAFYSGQCQTGALPPVSDLSIDQAYQIQDRVAEKRIGRGESVVGYKVGCTSAAIREQFSLDAPIMGRLFAPYVHGEGVNLFWDDFVNCAIEPELVLKMKTDLYGKNLDDQALLDAIEYVSPGIEVHHFRFWFSPNTSQELIASNGIHAGLVLGAQQAPAHNLDFKSEMFRVFKDNMLVTEAPACEIMGGVLNSLRWLVTFLSKRGVTLGRGSLVIPGSPVELVDVQQDIFLRIEIDKVGDVTTDFRTRNQ